jgi:hypothetical protein
VVLAVEMEILMPTLDVKELEQLVVLVMMAH